MNSNIVAIGMLFFGKPYIWGGNTPIFGMDCSGFACEVLRSLGIIGQDDYTARGLYDEFLDKEVNKPMEGSILFFGVSKTKITHVAIAINETLMIEAGGGDSKTVNTAEAVKKNAYIRIRPITNRRDLIAVINIED